MKYIIEATGNTTSKEFGNEEITVEINSEGSRNDLSIVFHLPSGKEWWILFREFEHLMKIVDLILRG